EQIEQVQRDAVEKAITVVKDRLELEKQATESGMSEITADHPEVQAMVEKAIRSASASDLPLSREVYAEVLEGAIAELMKSNKDRFPGAAEKGGWVVDNYPLSVDHWSALLEKGLLPDTVVCLKDTERDGVCTLARTYSANRDEINAKILKRLTDETLKKKEEDTEMFERIIAFDVLFDFFFFFNFFFPELVLPEFAENDLLNLPEMETIKRKLDLFMHDWQTVESEIKQSPLVQVVALEIAEQTPESLLNHIVLVMEKPFKYHGWELSGEDLEEEEEDLTAEGEDEEVEEENE
ncbi:KAD9 kinase, partial [Eubucco bourcierii]|nr:KAD9 kinase [Eubucco bourcierii]